MIEPVQRERIEAALLASFKEVGLNQSELGRRLGKGSTWISSVLKRVRDGNALTAETVNIIRVEVPNVETHLKSAGWWHGSTRKFGHVPVTRSTEHLRLRRNQLILKRMELDKDISETEQQIADLESMANA